MRRSQNRSIKKVRTKAPKVEVKGRLSSLREQLYLKEIESLRASSALQQHLVSDLKGKMLQLLTENDMFKQECVKLKVLVSFTYSN